MRVVRLMVAFMLVWVSGVASPASAQFRGEVIDGSSCKASVPFGGVPPRGGLVNGQGQLLFGAVTAVCSLAFGSHNLPTGTRLSWEASNLRLVFAELAAHTSGARVTARVCVRQSFSMLNNCGPSRTFTNTSSSAPAFASFMLTPPSGVVGAWSGAVIFFVDAGSTFTLLNINPLWW